MEMTATRKEEETGKDVTDRASRKVSANDVSIGSNGGEDEAAGKFGMRHVQVVLLFFGMIIGYCLRVSMSEAVVAMSNSSAANPAFEDFGWNSRERSQILSSFFWGYTVMQVPSGYIAGIWSGQKLLALGMLVCGVLNVLTPLAATYGNLIAVCGCRVGMGLAQGCLLPCTHTLLSKWAPPSERARLGTFAYAGAQLGTVIAFPISGVLAASAAGWPSIFYIFGALAILWAIVFFACGSDTPASHPRISDKEKRYIEESLKLTQGSKGQSEEKLKIPWKQIFSSPPMWALIIAHCGQNWGYWTLLTEMPAYMHAVLKFDIQQNGLTSALPYLVMWILSFPASWLSDYALKKGASRAITRKVSNTIAHWGPALALLSLGLVPTNESTVVAILIAAVGLNAGSLCGFQINHIDLSPNFAGTMMSITNCAASVIAIIAPLICGEIVLNEENEDLWRIVFFIAAGIYFIGNLVFIIFGQGEVQWWNDPRAVNDRKTRKQSVIA